MNVGPKGHLGVSWTLSTPSSNLSFLFQSKPWVEFALQIMELPPFTFCHPPVIPLPTREHKSPISIPMDKKQGAKLEHWWLLPLKECNLRSLQRKNARVDFPCVTQDLTNIILEEHFHVEKLMREVMFVLLSNMREFVAVILPFIHFECCMNLINFLFMSSHFKKWEDVQQNV